MNIFENNKIVSVIRFDDPAESEIFASGCISGGIKLLEVIINRPGALKTIQNLSKKEGVLVGAGTVLDLNDAKMAAEAGAGFIVSPHTNKDIIEFTKNSGLISVAGAFTSSEIVNATSIGADYVKIFPASSVGPGYIKAVKEALGDVGIMVTGGINLENVGEYINAGSSLAGISTALTQNKKVVDREEISHMARQFVEKTGSP